MQYTENIDLLKPDQNEQYDIDHFNRNADTLDEHIHDLETRTESLRADMEAGDAASRQFSNMVGVCQISQGGTGKTTAQDALNELHGDIQAEGTLSDVDEFLFLRRTHEDVAQGIPESLDTKSVLLDELAQKIFDIISGGSETPSAGSIFTPTTNGLAPKSGNNDGTKFLNALGQWAEPQGKTTVHEVTNSQNIEPDASTIVRIKANATVLVRDPSGYGESLVLSNETSRAQLVSIRLKGGSVSYKLNKGRTWRLMWNGSFWIPQFDEPQCGDVKSTYADTAPDGWFMCDGRDTTGTADELETCYPNLYDFVGGNILPDLRECALVGAGRNTRDSMVAHDEYTVGQFKDDQTQTHTHTIAHTHSINHTHTFNNHGIGFINTDFGGVRINNLCFGNETGTTGGPSNMNSGGPSTGDSGNNSGRSGVVTRGKRKGVNYIIKA